ncbi:MAG TPA: hypothetical protein VNT30_00305 [Stellaceae bacterium]|nr:hypothetical protein [Stellaceae bacterium]
MAVTEQDIWTTASMLVERAGDFSVEVATARADESAERGDSYYWAVWERVAWAAGQLLKSNEPDTRH